jgi:hypothetical protein
VCLEERSRSDCLKCSESGKQVFFQKITLRMRALDQVLLLLRRINYNNKESCRVLTGFFRVQEFGLSSRRKVGGYSSS